MATIIDYVKKYGDSTMYEMPFNEVDASILSLITYVDFLDIVPNKKGKYCLLSNALEIFLKHSDLKKFAGRGIVQKDLIKLSRILKDKIRFRNIEVSNYVYSITFEKQFCAMTFKLPTGEKIIAYEGTDHNLVGWEEDFAMCYSYPVPAHVDAINYINKNVNFFDKKVYVLGHSKGGHLAMAAASFGNLITRLKIKKVYNFDGPGFRKEQFESKKFKKMSEKIEVIVPYYSIFGMLLRHEDNIRSVKSNRKDIFAHSIFAWQVVENKFVDEPLSRLSINLDNSIVFWLEQHDDEERKRILINIFDFLKKCGVTNLFDIFKIKYLYSILKNVDELDKETVDVIKHFIKYNVEYHFSNIKDDIEVN